MNGFWLNGESCPVYLIVSFLVKLRLILKRYRITTDCAGHVLFFYNKLEYLQKRHTLICRELDKRNIKRDPLVIVDLSSLDNVLRACLCKDWQPTQKDHNINIERLQERFDLRKRAYHMTTDNIKQKIDCDYSFNQYCDQHLKKYYD